MFVLFVLQPCVEPNKLRFPSLPLRVRLSQRERGSFSHWEKVRMRAVNLEIILLLLRACGLFRRSYRCQNIWLIAKIFRRCTFDIFEGHSVHLALERFVMVEPQPTKLVQRALVAK